MREDHGTVQIPALYRIHRSRHRLDVLGCCPIYTESSSFGEQISLGLQHRVCHSCDQNGEVIWALSHSLGNGSQCRLNGEVVRRLILLEGNLIQVTANFLNDTLIVLSVALLIQVESRQSASLR